MATTASRAKPKRTDTGGSGAATPGGGAGGGSGPNGRRGSWRGPNTPVQGISSNQKDIPSKSSTPAPLVAASSPAPSASASTKPSSEITSDPAIVSAVRPPNQAASKEKDGKPKTEDNQGKPTDPTIAEYSRLTNSKVTVTLSAAAGSKSYEGTLESVKGGPKLLTLRLVREVGAIGAGVEREKTFSLKDVVEVKSGVRNGANGDSSNGSRNGREGFRTDSDISGTAFGRERVLTPWADTHTPAASASPAPSARSTDADTFGSSSSGKWDQFAANEQRFGVKSDFEEELYTTKLDRSGADYKDRERKAAALAAEINGTAATNSHIAEERGQINAKDFNDLGEEDKYSGVVRAPNAYVPPNARRAAGGPIPVTPTNKALSRPSFAAAAAGGSHTAPAVPRASLNSPASAAPSPSPAPASLGMARSSSSNVPAVTKVDVPVVSAEEKDVSALPTVKLPASATQADGAAPIPAHSAFQNFVKTEAQRMENKKKQLAQKTQVEKEKKLKELQHEKENKLKELKQFGQEFKLVTPIPQDLVPILAKDSDKQKAIVEKAQSDAVSALNRSPVTPGKPSSQIPPTSFANRHKLLAQDPIPPANIKQRIPMNIQDIPPFKANVPTKSDSPAKPANTNLPSAESPALVAASVVPAAAPPTSSTKLNVNAPSFVFKPNPKAAAFKPSGSALSPSPRVPVKDMPLSPSPSVTVPQQTSPLTNNAAPAQPEVTMNPFFRDKLPRKAHGVGMINVRDDFSPHKNSKMAEPTSYAPNWPFSGPPYRTHIPQVHQPHLGGEDSHPHLPESGPHRHANGPHNNQHSSSLQQQHNQQQIPQPPHLPGQPQQMYPGGAFPYPYAAQYQFNAQGMPMGQQPRINGPGGVPFQPQMYIQQGQFPIQGLPNTGAPPQMYTPGMPQPFLGPAAANGYPQNGRNQQAAFLYQGQMQSPQMVAAQLAYQPNFGQMGGPPLQSGGVSPQVAAGVGAAGVSSA